MSGPTALWVTRTSAVKGKPKAYSARVPNSRRSRLLPVAAGHGVGRTKGEIKSHHERYSNRWGPLRSLLRERCTAYRLVQIVSRAGIVVTRLSGIPLTSNTSDKNELIARVDEIYSELNPPDKKRFLTTVTEELLEEKPELEPLIEKHLRRLGWKVHEGMVVPVNVFDVDDLSLLPEESHQDLLKASQLASGMAILRGRLAQHVERQTRPRLLSMYGTHSELRPARL